MSNLHPSRSGAPAFPGDTPPGIYVVASAPDGRRLAQQATATGFDVSWIDAAEIDSKATFLATFARELRFPDYFGHNWDALNDCLRDLGYLPGNGIVIVIDQFDRFASHDPQEWSTALHVLREATNDSRHEGHPIYVLLRSPAAAAPGIAEW
jgi:RNAse (barnase) inhibitor barstar